MPLSVTCTGCNKTIRVADAKRGRRIKCPLCTQAIQVPDDEDLDSDDLDAEDSVPAASRMRTKKKRSKRASGDGGLKLMIGIGVAVVLLVGIGLAMRRSGTSAELPAPPASETPANLAITTPAAAANTASLTPGISPSAPTIAPSVTPSPVPKSANADDDNEPKPTPESLSSSDAFFTQGMIPELRIEISEFELEKLKAGPRSFVIGAPRPYVQGTLYENGKKTYQNVAIKLKGSAGSFRPVDERPALSINVGKYEKDQTFHGLSKFHLNNSVQDDTYLHEWLCEELFRAAKIPATRVTHARVWLNGRDLGLYVLKSSFDKSFLQRHFDDIKGNLYEGGFVQDLDADLEKDAGKGVDDRSDLKELLAACREPDPYKRWERVDELLNVEHFITFMAMEMMIGHWDGYTLNHNNYRLYFDAPSGQAHFLPHGMDQVFGDPNASIINFPSSIMASTVMLNGEWRARFRERVKELLEIFSPTDTLLKRIDTVNDRLRPILQTMNPQSAIDHDARVNHLKERLVARVANLIQQQSQPDPQPQEFDASGRLNLVNWNPVSETPDAKLEIVELPRGPKAYSILCGPKSPCNSSWRCKTLLAKGTYILHANIQSKTINAKDEKNISVGAGIRIAGLNRDNVRKGTSPWAPVEFEFTVIEEVRNIEFIAELRAKKGQVWFEADSLYLTRKSSE